MPMHNPRYEEKVSTGAVLLSSDQPIDDIAAHQMQTIARKGRGFVLDVAAGQADKFEALREKLVGATTDLGDKPTKDALADAADVIDDAIVEAIALLASPTIEVRESLPQHDEWQPVADNRNHELRDTTSFIAYAMRYGAKDDSLVFYAEDKFTLVIDEMRERGKREVATMPVVLSPDWLAWAEVINEPTTHKELVQFLMKQEHNLADGGVLTAMQSLRLNSVINLESDVSEEGNNFAISVKTNGGEAVKKFPKSFAITLPVLKQDVDADQITPAKIRLNIVLPDRADHSPVFTLYCSAWDQILIRRVEKEGDLIQAALPDWAVVHGVYRTTPR